MLKGIKFQQQKPNLQAEIDLLLSNTDKKFVPQKKWKKEKIEKIQEDPFKKVIEVKELKTMAQEIWENFLTNDVKQCAQKCHKLIKIQDEYFRESAPLKISFNENSTSLNPLEDEFEEEIQKYNTSSKKSNFQTLQSDLMKNLKTSQFEDKKVDYNYDKMSVKFMNKYKNIMNSEDLYDLMEENPDNKKLDKKDKKYLEKQKNFERNKEKSFHRKTERVLTSCKYCLANKFIPNEQILKLGNYCALIIPKLKRYEKNYFQILTLDHYSSSLEVEDDIYDEIVLMKKKLIKLFKSFNQSVIFFEVAINLKSLPHCIIEAVALPSNLISESQLYFKKAFLEMESEWSIHKKIIDILNEKGGIRKQIPKNFPFFYVDFNDERGYAHVIEKERNFDKFSHHEIMGSILEIEKNDVLKPQHLEKKEIEEAKNKFLSLWEKENISDLIIS